MKKSVLIKLGLIAATGGVLLTGCASHEKEVYHASTYPPTATVERRVVVTTQPPPVTVEQRVVSPGPEYVWIDGYWEWNGGRWVWRKGHWVRPPHHGHTWVAPRYENRTYYYGYWR